MNLTHLDEQNKPKMVDVSDKDQTQRVATASGTIDVSQEAFDAVINNSAKKRSSVTNGGHSCHSGHQADQHTHPNVPSAHANLCQN